MEKEKTKKLETTEQIRKEIYMASETSKKHLIAGVLLSVAITIGVWV